MSTATQPSPVPRELPRWWTSLRGWILSGVLGWCAATAAIVVTPYGDWLRDYIVPAQPLGKATKADISAPWRLVLQTSKGVFEGLLELKQTEKNGLSGQFYGKVESEDEVRGIVKYANKDAGVTFTLESKDLRWQVSGAKLDEDRESGLLQILGYATEQEKKGVWVDVKDKLLFHATTPTR